MFDRILIPTDGSDAVTPAVENAVTLAEIHDATLHALFIVENPVVSGVGEGNSELESYMEYLEEEGTDVTASVATRAEDHGVETEISVREGAPSETILEYATAHDIDLIVMGTHGRTGVKRALVGSVTEGVVRHADVPVLTVRHDTE
ncbi:Nucleotide-binding universal stress protein, UspA family [Halovenus aranensis]|jgi:nucleotide-binding universal stress UspA family protein|uniref:Nucleotide-binding universal stress protein, UspA family n=1 Tax=Halovenus aranensis TaxID=890420 RepID=A0A1G8VTK2_9EURY|nr:universal stress protein [Halovenus aranensis]SDJ69329.1 Nucleotide-binding universal stress protein, UspA family [Halovenus aranensis]